MKLELKHLAPYLPYRVKGLDEQQNQIEVIGVKNETYFIDSGNNYAYGDIQRLKPILRPLSDLTKEIEVNGEKFVPIDWIDKNHNANNYAPCAIMLDGTIELGFYKDFQKLFEWHFDVFGLIEKGLAIDINTLNQ